jgi:hypothetical protein
VPWDFDRYSSLFLERSANDLIFVIFIWISNIYCIE